MISSPLIQVPGTNFVVLEDDECLGRWAMESGSIVGEKYIFDLPEVRALGPGSVCVDAGSFIGDTSWPLLQKGCEVYAFEACEDAFKALRINCPTAHSFNVILGDGRLAQADGVYGENNRNAGTRMVTAGDGKPTFRIDSLNLSRVDYFKADVEGFELPVLIGAKETILRTKCMILVEVYDGMLEKQGFCRKDITDFMDSIGYSWRVAIGRWEDERCDLLCVPKG